MAEEEMARTGFMCYHDMLSYMEPYSDEERGRLFTAMLTYSITGEVPTLTGNERFIWPAIRANIDRDREAYEATCEKNRRNIAKRYGRAESDTTVNEPVPPNTTVYDPIPDVPTTTTTTTITPTTTTTTTEENPAPERGSGGGKSVDQFGLFAKGDRDLLFALRDFEKMRNKKKKPLTDNARQRLLAKLEKDFPRDQWIAVLNQSVDKGWADIYPLDSLPPSQPAPAKPKQYTTSAEYNSRPRIAPSQDYMEWALSKI